ncbi:nucleoside hydrolase-like [Argiope bruennichi]|uniref:Inosine-uridine preferring nucleoside like protein n=1 Tax=Argiope bruennichi TaxID=94029 RepID=A0A8T0FH96_ARGBR|nr:nucleoside hydrolase-like [Argiope bruennichi]XP_055942724.1 nucleoside hydrolase-like [Argiope bruennichi]XP_055942725.1 nucleoside hydrolase-like [Argiope bruennichi]KAF8788243.1 Inosine-uridine preferring nucleoside like protein [Argiope bruennichi]
MSQENDSHGLLVIDTDCGSDDAMAIMAALGQWGRKSRHLLAITCCFGNTTVEHVCQNVLRVLHACRETNIPVYSGSSGPILKHPDTPEIVHGSDGFGDCAHLFSTGQRRLEELPAPAALVELSRIHGPFTLAALGPLTNVALAHRLDPGFTARLERIVFLGGNYKGVGNTTECAEFNFYCDPEAAHIVLSEAQCPVQMVPWETTLEYGIDWEEFNALLETPTDRARLLKGATNIVKEICVRDGYGQFLDCDLLAVAVALRPECVTGSRRTCASVECSGTLTRGMVVCQKPRPSRSQIDIVEKLDEKILNRLRNEMVQQN